MSKPVCGLDSGMKSILNKFISFQGFFRIERNLDLNVAKRSLLLWGSIYLFNVKSWENYNQRPHYYETDWEAHISNRLSISNEILLTEVSTRNSNKSLPSDQRQHSFAISLIHQDSAINLSFLNVSSVSLL